MRHTCAAGSGTAMAVEAADVTLFTNDLTCLPDMLKLGHRTRQTIFQNISLAVMTKVRGLLNSAWRTMINCMYIEWALQFWERG